MAYSISASIELSVPSTICSTIGSMARGCAQRRGRPRPGLRLHVHRRPRRLAARARRSRMPCVVDLEPSGREIPPSSSRTPRRRPGRRTRSRPASRRGRRSACRGMRRRNRPAACRRGAGCLAAGELWDRRPLDHAEAGDAEIDDLDLLPAGIIVAEGLEMRGVERVDGAGDERRVDPARRRGNADLHRLARRSARRLRARAGCASVRCRRASSVATASRSRPA